MTASIKIKILVVGNSGVGKTSLCNRYLNDEFIKAYKPTVGVEFSSKEFISRQQNKFNFQFWDIGGQERYIYMTHVYYKNADYCLIMFDLTKRESFEACAKWKRDLDQKYQLADGSKCPCLLLGNKCELSNRVVDQFEIEDFCKAMGFEGYMEVSVKNDIMVKETVNYISEKLLLRKEEELMLRQRDDYDDNFRHDVLLLKQRQKSSSPNSKEDQNKVSCFQMIHSRKCCF